MSIDQLYGSFPVIVGERVRLGKIEPAHLNDVFAIYDNDRVFEFCGIIPKHNIETVSNMIGHFERDYLKRSRVKWGIFLNDAPNKLVGIAEAFDYNQKVNMITIGYFLEESYWAQGIASESVRLLLRYLFETVEINRIQAEVMIGNEASKRVLTKNGFIKEGTIRQGSVWSGKGVVDLELYAILRNEYTGMASLP
ncbi:GNAT family N-acetyltransferase [Cohnella sp. AR92]|uniref:GNAT family N-acetyltransferase n=1 Tax=Cohnella sp. AR92 TaxID=648716 RepID=UPI000F8E62A9|nr:GNAT family protein [Cohnella sp. AR92]RUS47890.1 N-acetyltransferase [Cohnella sp. AR92]